jgi:hypothetical protein
MPPGAWIGALIGAAPGRGTFALDSPSAVAARMLWSTASGLADSPGDGCLAPMGACA